MNFFECCHICKPPKRHPGCQDHCPEYAAGKKKHDAMKAADDKRRQISNSVYTQKSDAITKAIKRHGR